MKKLILCLLLIAILSIVCFGSKEIEERWSVPLNTEDIITVSKYGETFRFSKWYYYPKKLKGIAWKETVSITFWKTKRIENAVIRYDTFGQCLMSIKKKYTIIKIFKDAIDDDYFICVKALI